MNEGVQMPRDVDYNANIRSADRGSRSLKRAIDVVLHVRIVKAKPLQLLEGLFWGYVFET